MNLRRWGKRWVLYVILASMITTYVLGRMTSKPGPPLPVMPPGILIDHQVKEIPVENPLNNEMAGQLQRTVAQLERLALEKAGLLKIVERLKLKAVAVIKTEPEIEEIADVLDKAVDLGSLFALATADVQKFEGLHEGKLRWGFEGFLGCDIRASEEDDWTRIMYSPIKLEASTAITTQAPVIPKKRWTADLRLGIVTTPGFELGLSIHKRSRIGWYAGFQYDIDPDSFTTLVERLVDDEYSVLDSLTFEADKLRGSFGLSVRVGRR